MGLTNKSTVAVMAILAAACVPMAWGAEDAGHVNAKDGAGHTEAGAKATTPAELPVKKEAQKEPPKTMAKDMAKEMPKEMPKDAAKPDASKTTPAMATKADEKPKAMEAKPAAAAEAPTPSVPADPAKEQSLADQIRDALGGKGLSTISLGKSNREKAREKTMAEAGSESPKPAKAAKPRVARRAAKPIHRESEIESPQHMSGLTMAGHRGEAHWSYEGVDGPQAWDKLDPAYALCGSGTRQSPIHIESQKTLLGPDDDLEFNYAPGKAAVANTGHTFQVDMAEGSGLVARGEAYKLVQFHFHHPSEERIDYRGYPMVVHLVHKSASGKLAVVAVELEVGDPNEAIAKAWRSLPLDAGDKAGVGMGGMDPALLLPPVGQRKYFQFIGSLTTPPCSEGVLWTVLKTPMTVSREQLALFTRFFPMNARPTQPDYGRLIREQE